jgi:hypothetical protein
MNGQIPRSIWVALVVGAVSALIAAGASVAAYAATRTASKQDVDRNYMANLHQGVESSRSRLRQERISYCLVTYIDRVFRADRADEPLPEPEDFCPPPDFPTLEREYQDALDRLAAEQKRVKED